MNKFDNCNTKEEIMKEILKGGNKFEASTKFLELGFTQESIDFYKLSQQEKQLDTFTQLISIMSNSASSNQSAGQFMIQASENNKQAASQMSFAAEEMANAARKMHQY